MTDAERAAQSTNPTSLPTPPPVASIVACYLALLCEGLPGFTIRQPPAALLRPPQPSPANPPPPKDTHEEEDQGENDSDDSNGPPASKRQRTNPPREAKNSALSGTSAQNDAVDLCAPLDNMQLCIRFDMQQVNVLFIPLDLIADCLANLVYSGL